MSSLYKILNVKTLSNKDGLLTSDVIETKILISLYLVGKNQATKLFVKKMKGFLKSFILIFAIAIAVGESESLKKRIYNFNPSVGHRKIKTSNENIRSTSYIKCR